MPRKIDTCMFCMASPCECEGSTKAKQKKKSSPKPQDLSDLRPTPVARPDFKAAMRAAMPKLPPQLDHDSMTAEEQELERALNALAPILHPEERERFAHILDRPDSRAARWKARNVRN